MTLFISYMVHMAIDVNQEILDITEKDQIRWVRNSVLEFWKTPP